MRLVLVLFTVVPALLVEAVAVPAHADKWVGRAYSASGDAPKIVLRGRTILGDDGAAYFAGRFRCIGSCLAPSLRKYRSKPPFTALAASSEPAFLGSWVRATGIRLAVARITGTQPA